MNIADLQRRVLGSNPPVQLLLDDFPNAAAAYSLRLLSSSYTGNCIEVRRSSDDTTQNIGFVNGVLDTASLLSFVGAGDGFVRTWYDQSGQGRNVIQTTNGSQPSIVLGGVLILESGLVRIKFNGTSQKLLVAFPLLNQPNTIFSVARADSLDNAIRLLYDDDNGNNRNTLAKEFPNGVSAFAGSILQTFSFSWGFSQRLHNVLYNGSSSFIRQNGVSILTGNVGTQGLSGFTIGARFQDFFWQGSATEIIIYNSNKTSDSTGIESNINAFYNIF